MSRYGSLRVRILRVGLGVLVVAGVIVGLTGGTGAPRLGDASSPTTFAAPRTTIPGGDTATGLAAGAPGAPGGAGGTAGSPAPGEVPTDVGAPKVVRTGRIDLELAKGTFGDSFSAVAAVAQS